MPAPVRAPRDRIHEHVYPKVIWRHAVSLGLPYDGRLVDGTQLPIDGPAWVTWDPVTDSVPNQPDRLYGNQHTIKTIIAVTEAYHEAHPDAPRIVVGDISRTGGGPMDEHVSHQNGLASTSTTRVSTAPSALRPRAIRSTRRSPRISSTASSPPALE
jgi:murein endopeptidase